MRLSLFNSTLIVTAYMASEAEGVNIDQMPAFGYPAPQ